MLPLFDTSFSLSDDETVSGFRSLATMLAINNSSASNGSAGVSSLIFFKSNIDISLLNLELLTRFWK